MCTEMHSCINGKNGDENFDNKKLGFDLVDDDLCN